MPKTLARVRWDLEFVDGDNDWALDVAICCENCPPNQPLQERLNGTFADSLQDIGDIGRGPV